MQQQSKATGRTKDKRIWVCKPDELSKGSYKKLAILYAGKPESVVVFKHNNACQAYLNHCVHMPRTLDCERNTIFDQTGKYLRCSFHGIVYEPLTGESISTMCNGEKLTSIRLFQNKEGIWLNDKRVRTV